MALFWRPILFYGLVILHTSSAFTHPSIILSKGRLPCFTVAKKNDATQDPIESMVLDLSNETSDDIRRDTLRKQLTGYLDSGNLEMAQRLDACIVATGSRLQKEPSANQTQLWALVDMMVQTKTILNRFRTQINPEQQAKE